ncbi:S-adenosylmethionine synthetase [candidate division MSBL1 archaeon SCGC-AAA382C18]|uniref:S-adenosylmethionine synthetase n=1 Tax=candidate division MSBL1 archaeon SCGC-AAA382C18 TaxID=1698281 RepID=A0A133VIZ7_9EURY|nr:S-adenosylmethionine synthetase [candidate division MSBL1 archaeon SCGC-AAA382C18]
MAKNVVVEHAQRPKIESRNVEIVERKGIGHPDTLADGISEAVSEALSKEYLEKFGKVLHHNTDKVLIVGGKAKPEYQGGTIEKPMHIVVAGRGTTKVGDEKMPINEIAKKTCKEYLDKTVRNLDVEKHTEIDSRIGSGSVDLKNVFEEQGVPSSNDTSTGTAYAPFSETEKLALETEKALNSEEFKNQYPAVGEDIKVMIDRENSNINLTVAMATVSSYLDDLNHYISLKEDIKDYIQDLASKITEKTVEVHLNTADNHDEGVVYKTVTGTSAEMGDDGMTGRGNRTNGLISFDRPMSLEAAAGKNPVNHVGKIYNLLSMEVAQEVSEIEGVTEVFVRTLSQIGEPIDKPKIMNIKLLSKDGVTVDNLKSDVRNIAEEHLENIENLSQRIINGELSVY